MKLTNRILKAIVEMGCRVEAGDVEDYQGFDGKEERKAYNDAIDAMIWARAVLRKRREKRAAKKPKA
jgi:hypothetical protein